MLKQFVLLVVVLAFVNTLPLSPPGLKLCKFFDCVNKPVFVWLKGAWRDEPGVDRLDQTNSTSHERYITYIAHWSSLQLANYTNQSENFIVAVRHVRSQVVAGFNYKFTLDIASNVNNTFQVRNADDELSLGRFNFNSKSFNKKVSILWNWRVWSSVDIDAVFSDCASMQNMQWTGLQGSLWSLLKFYSISFSNLRFINQ